MRVAFTIVLNNLKMLKKQVNEGILNKFDFWILIEGAANNSGSTSWCNQMSDEFHNNGKSVDGTHEYLKELANENPGKVVHIHREGLWESKDEQVNQIVNSLQNIQGCYLWEIDVDEFWDKDSLKLAEYQLTHTKSKGASFLCDYFVGDEELYPNRQLIVKGGWGEGNMLRYNRLWLWQWGDKFLTHEPPMLEKQTKTNTVELPYRFRHYSYTDNDTVLFKDKWYGGHEGIHNNWRAINMLYKDKFPIPINELLPDAKWDDGKTQIHWVDEAEFILYIQWFRSDNSERNEEIITAIKKNASNPHIKKIYIFAENEFTETIDKVEIIDIGRRMTYLDCFQHIKLVSTHESFVIIANSDIVIPVATTEKLQYQDITLDNAFIALSRYEYENGKITYVGAEMSFCSQDVWIFKPKDISLEKFNRSYFYLGICSCDNIIARIAHDAGMKVINPSHYLVTVHLHESRYRTYSNNSGYYGPITFIEATDNLSEEAELHLSHSVWEKPIYI